MFAVLKRFSHGEVVYVSELREFLEFDLSKLEEGSSCLARHEDGIWYPAKIKGINERGLSRVLHLYATLTGLVMTSLQWLNKGNKTNQTSAPHLSQKSQN